MSAAIAMFVKTPGLSPVKTRLASDLGERAAAEFYDKAVACVAAVAGAAELGAPHLTPLWAVAEREAVDHPRWQAFPRIWQGEGDLGDRLNTVHAMLCREHEVVVLVGADTPQITVELLQESIDAVGRPDTPYALGRASDGGFWIFASRQAVPASVWTSVRYSRCYTATQLSVALRPLGGIAELPARTDVDTGADLRVARLELHDLADPLPEQVGLRIWLDGLVLPNDEGAISF